MHPRTNVLGVGVSAVNMALALDTIAKWIDSRDRRYVCVTGVHGVMESQRSEQLRRIHNAAGMVTPDGMPLVWALRADGHTHADRVCGPELLPAVFDYSQDRGWRHFLYGATEETLQRLQDSIQARAPRARIVGRFSPPFRALSDAESREIANRINECQPDIVWVGLSTPKQEYWMSEHRALLEAPVLLGVGAAFDMHAGIVRRAPHFLRRTGLEWTYRLLKEPRRLWKRYLRNNANFLALFVLQHAGIRRRQLSE